MPTTKQNNTMKIEIKNIFGDVKINGEFSSLADAIMKYKSNLYGADLYGANLRGADLSGADLRGADLRGADLSGADLCGEKIKSCQVINGAYKYTIIIMLTVDGKQIVKMGCLKKTLEEWDAIGIRNSNLSEFPDNKSFASEQRAIAFEYAKSICLLMK